MTFRPHLKHEPSLLNFLKFRRIIKHIFKSRQKRDTERNSYRRIANILSAGGNPFDKHRIQTFVNLQNECLLDINQIESSVSPIITSTYECMATLSELLTPQERASLVGATPTWLAQRSERWEEMGLFQLYFNLMCENEKSSHIENRSMFWFCGLMVSRNTTIHETLMMEDEAEIIEAPKLAHLSLVK